MNEARKKKHLNALHCIEREQDRLEEKNNRVKAFFFVILPFVKLHCACRHSPQVNQQLP